MMEQVANYAFSPNPQATGIKAAERALRRQICAKYFSIEERRCFCHRLVLILKHTYGDSENDASELFKHYMDRIYAFFDIINCSKKNVQELRRVQENDINRVGAVVDVTVARRLTRCYRLYPYASSMESQTEETAEAKREWSTKNIDCREALTVMKIVVPMIERIQTWVTYLQNSTSPSVPLLLYIMDDLIFICDDFANRADADKNQDTEIILSRALAELKNLMMISMTIFSNLLSYLFHVSAIARSLKLKLMDYSAALSIHILQMKSTTTSLLSPTKQIS